MNSRTPIDELDDKVIERNRRWIDFFKKIILPVFRKKFNVSAQKHDLPSGGNLILANHVTKNDQFFVANYFRDHHIIYVGGENLFRNPFIRWFVEKQLGAIRHIRGVSSMNTIRQMTKRLQKGLNVMIFPEGSMSFDGRTKAVSPAIAKLARVSGANLVLLKIEGGYLSQPRWGVSVRKGYMDGSMFTVSRDELKSMTVQKISDLINEKLFTDAYEEQGRRPVKFTGASPCKGLESCIYECPECGEISTLKTSDTELFCSCGYSADFDEYGWLNDRKGNRYTIAQCCDRQKQRLRERVKQAAGADGSSPLLEDELNCKRLYFDGRQDELGTVKLSVYTDRADWAIAERTGSIEYDRINGIFIILRNTLSCTVQDLKYEYELRGDFSFNALKYRDLFEIVKEK